MVMKLSESPYREATGDEKHKLLEDLPAMTASLEDAPVVMENSIVFAVIDGIAYPLQELAEATKQIPEG